MLIAGTGHRPQSLGQRWTPDLKLKMESFAIDALTERNVSEVISGMALGWDQALATAAHALDIPFIAAVPFVGQDRTWGRREREEYNFLLSKAVRTVVVCPFSLNIAYHRRNEWMVDELIQRFYRPSRLLALWNGNPGGTSHCVEYAAGWMVPTDNLWDAWIEYLKESRQ